MRSHIPFSYDFFKIGGVFSIEHTLSWPSYIPGAPYPHVANCYLLAPADLFADKHQILVFSPQFPRSLTPLLSCLGSVSDSACLKLSTSTSLLIAALLCPLMKTPSFTKLPTPESCAFSLMLLSLSHISSLICNNKMSLDLFTLHRHCQLVGP